ncbi:heterokaryon incompatibility protein-domain-containing protein [Apiospora kogelbergensis]|uniref:heterokaryon incompatibility protein-domain-containing protein n=1 Tax=Apiospora kogelbergensis TaxID=1337665 RepID=UPI00312CD0E9
MLLGYTAPTYSHPAARKVSPSVALGYTGSTVSFNSIKTWLEDCETSHEGCRPLASVFPDRVVELSTDAGGQVVFRLEQSLGRRQESYACLSHRWGPSTGRCKTTTKTLAAHLEQIPSHILPKTFQEASKVALHLGLKYLWIDSLCIIQDDTEDWKIQAAQMCNIYSGAYVTIAATSSSDSDNGMFHIVAKIPISPVETKRSDIFIREYPDHEYMNNRPKLADLSESAEFPLLRRGWVYQERLLSPRFVHFTRNEVSMECSGNKGYCECGGAASHRSKKNELYSWTDSSDVKTLWRQMARDYSYLGLTYGSDRIPALAGIARHFGTKHRSSLGGYVAGLWENSLAQDLLWVVPPTRSCTRPEFRPVPSWSWASVTSGVVWPYYWREMTAPSGHIHVVSYHVELAGPDEFGPIQHAEMTVRGLLAEGSWTVDSGSPDGKLIQYRPGYIGSTGTGGYEMYPDYTFSDALGSHHLEEGCRVFCLKTGFEVNDCYACLILRSLNEEQTGFERVGVLKTAPKDVVDSWYEEGQVAQTFKLL